MIGLMDCNNFFVSCERLFRPDLVGKPVAVLSSNDGCIVARSQEVKDLGIPMGIPYFKVRDICTKHKVTLFSGNIALYRDISSRVMTTLRREVGEVEVYSIDEAFFALPETVTEEAVRSLRAIVMQEVGIPVSIGVATTKTLAKYASDRSKKEGGVLIIRKGMREAILHNAPIEAFWGIGGKTAAKLYGLGIDTGGKFLTKDLSFIRANFGVMGERMHHELSGIPAHDLHEAVGGKKSIMSSRMFGRTLSNLPDLESALGYHVARVAEKLRDMEAVAAHLYVSLRTNRHGDYMLRGGTREIMLSTPTNHTNVLLREALTALHSLYEREVPYQKVGVALSGIVPAACIPLSLFDEAIERQHTVIDATVDALNKKFGHHAVRPGIVMHTDRFAPLHTMRSNAYTTNWKELASVRA